MSTHRIAPPRRPLVPAAVLAACMSAGCLSSNVLITVRPDGSGTIEQSIVLRPAAFAQFQRLVDPAAPPRLPAASLSQAQWNGYAAATAGRAARLRSARAVKTADTAGWVVTYDFDDVADVEVELVPAMPGMSSMYGVAAADAGASTRLRMALEPVGDDRERLTVRFPRFAMDPSAEPPAAWATGSPQEMAALRGAFHGSRLTFAVRTEAPLLSTNSPYRDENTVTLLDADLEQALFSRQLAMLVTTPARFEELLSAVADLPGVRLAHEHDITLEFARPSLQASVPPPRPADTDIFLATLSQSGDVLTVGPPVNITNSPGYDNQPSFTADGRQILFASDRGVVTRDRASSPARALPATDIYRYEIATRRIWRVTNTPESEFSPLLMPDGARVSLVRVERDGTQRLWSVKFDGSPSEAVPLLPDVKPVGYHAWVDERTVALYVLGAANEPSTLQVADLDTGKTEVVATNIGRSLQRMPSGAISFVQRDPGADGSPAVATIKQLFNAAQPQRRSIGVGVLTRPAAGTADPFLAWLPDGSALMGSGTTLYRWRPGSEEWTIVARLEGSGLSDVSRLAVSPTGDRLAIVAQVK